MNGESSELLVEPDARRTKECTNRDLKADPSFCDSKVPYATDTACRRFTCVATTCQTGFEVVNGECKCPVGSKLVSGACSASRCKTVEGLQWCNDPDVLGEDCTTLCSDLRMTVLSVDATWTQAQDTEAECIAIANAFAIPYSTLYVGSYTYACASYGTGSSPNMACSTLPACPANHRTTGDPNRYQICPCVP